MDPLEDPVYAVSIQPAAERGVAWLRGHAPRFAEGATHARRRDLAERLLAGVDLDRLRRPGSPVANLAEALGLPRTTADDVARVAPCWQPHTGVTPDADAAVTALVTAAGGTWDEATAVRLSLLVQAHDATRAALRGQEPPVPATRRIAPDGSEVLVDLAGRPFGAGRHGCPGRAQAEALIEGARSFAALHDELLVLPNAWDVASAFALVDAGFPAIGTTSLGVAGAHGLPDARAATRDETVALAARLVRLPVPVTVDIEYGLGGDPAALAVELSVLGVAGVNLEDGRPDGLAEPAEQAALIEAVKGAAPELFVNARTDTWWQGRRQEETRERLDRYVAAGADGVFVPGLRDPEQIRALTAELPVPVNLLAQLPVRRLRDLGVRRVSTGSLLFRAAVAATVRAAEAVRDGDPPSGLPSYDDVAGRVLG